MEFLDVLFVFRMDLESGWCSVCFPFRQRVAISRQIDRRFHEIVITREAVFLDNPRCASEFGGGDIDVVNPGTSSSAPSTKGARILVGIGLEEGVGPFKKGDTSSGFFDFFRVTVEVPPYYVDVVFSVFPFTHLKEKISKKFFLLARSRTGRGVNPMYVEEVVIFSASYAKRSPDIASTEVWACGEAGFNEGYSGWG